MDLFDAQIAALRNYVAEREATGITRITAPGTGDRWPTGGTRNVVLAQDTAVELGNPRDESCCFLLWTNDPAAVRDRAITRIGPDLPACRGTSIPFGKVVVVGGMGFNEENAWQRHRELETLRYDIDLRGYMLRGVSQYSREWSRVSAGALDAGFDFGLLGDALVRIHHRPAYVRAVEVLFVTSSPADVRGLAAIGDRVSAIAGAMNRMAQELSFECDTCDYTDVCGEVSSLRSMRRTLKEGRREKE